MSSTASTHASTDAQSNKRARLGDLLRRESVGGILLLVAAAAAMIWANTPWAEHYHRLGDFQIGPESIHLNLSLAAWAADGLLAVFFFIVGLELKHEFLEGDLRDPKRAAVPIAAAIGGMAGPALVFVAINLNAGGDALNGWAVPTATDIAFALAVLAVVATQLPLALRTFLLTLAVVDDLFAVTVIAVFYTDTLNLVALVAFVVPLVTFGVAARFVRSPWVLIPLAGLAWFLMHEAGVHATIAGVLLGLSVPVRRAAAERGLQAKDLEHRMRPWSAGIALPVFAFFAAGVTVGGLDGLQAALADSVSLGIIAGLVIGKAVGITGAAALVATLSPAELDRSLKWVDVLGVALLGGIGFTVSLLIGDLAFAGDTLREDYVKLAVLIGTVIAATLAATVLGFRNRTYGRVRMAHSANLCN